MEMVGSGSVTLASRLLKVQESLLNLSSDTQLRDLLVQVANGANELLGAHFSVVEPYFAEEDRFLVDQFVSSSDINPTTNTLEWQEPRPEGTTRLILEKGEIFIENYDQYLAKHFQKTELAEERGRFEKQFGIKAAIGIKLQALAEPVGVLYINFVEPQKQFTYEERDVARLFASQAAIAIHNFRLFEKEREQRAFSDALQGISREINKEIAENNVLRRILDEAIKVLEYDSASIMVIEHDGETALIRQDRGYIPSIFHKKLSVSEFWTLSEMCVTRLPCLIHDVSKNPLWILDPSNPKARSFLGSPIIIRGEVRGFICLDSNKPETYKDSDKTRLAAFAQQAAVAIDNSLHLHTLGQVQEVAKKIVEDTLSDSFNLNEFLKSVINKTQDLFHFEFAALVLKEGRYIRIVATDQSHSSWNDRRYPIDQSLSGASMKIGKAIYVPDTQNENDPNVKIYKNPHEESSFRSDLVVPLLIGDRAIGAFNVESRKVDAFDKRERDLLEILSGYVALAIQLERSKEEARTFQETAVELSAELSKDVVIPTILNNALKLIGTSYGQILVLNDKSLTVEHASDIFATTLGASYSINDCVSGLAVLENAPVIVDEVRKQNYLVVQFANQESSEVITEELKIAPKILYKQAADDLTQLMHSEMVVPLIWDRIVEGVLSVESEKEAFFTHDHARILRDFAKQVAGALRRVRKQRKIEEANRAQQQAEFAQRFTAGMTHQVRSPSSGILADISFIKEDFPSLLESEPELMAYVERIERAAQQINDLPNVIVAKARRYQIQHLTVRQLINQTIKSINSGSNVRKLANLLDNLELDPSVNSFDLFEADSETHIVLENLLVNARDVFEVNIVAHPKVIIGADISGENHIDMWVEDNGPGIPDAIKSSVFSQEFSTRDSGKGGIGLWWSKNHLKAIGATIWVEDAHYGHGARFVIRFNRLDGGNLNETQI